MSYDRTNEDYEARAASDAASGFGHHPPGPSTRPTPMNEALLARLILLQMRQAHHLATCLDLHNYEGTYDECQREMDAARKVQEDAEKLVAESTPPAVS